MDIIIIIALVLMVAMVMITLTSTNSKEQNKRVIENYDYSKYQRECNHFNRKITEYNELQETFVREYNVKIQEMQAKQDFSTIKELLSINEDFDKYSGILKHRIEEIRDMLNDQADVDDINNSLFDMEEYFRKLKTLIADVTYIYADEKSTYKYEETENMDDFRVDEKYDKSSLSFFEGCKTQIEADKRYKALAKAFHPDSGCGNKDLFNKMKEEYDSLSF